MSGYKGGRISRIKLKGFMTYDELDIRPKRGLNLIIGLNGSGKSSIMSAICLGLGGKPQFTGRSFQTSDFINFKHTKAEIEIEFTLVLQLSFTKSLARISNLVAAVVKKYNIDMGNLCQFLPQEKVAEFSKMDKKQRLENMIKAIGEPSLVTMFGDLKDMRKEFCHVEKEIEILENEKDSEAKLKEILKPHLQRQEERIQLKVDLALLRIKKLIAQYNKLQHLAVQLKKIRKSMKAEISGISTALSSLRSEKDSLFYQYNSYRLEINDATQRISYLVETLSKHSDRLRMLHGEVDNAKINLRNQITKKEEQKAKLTELISKIKGLQGELNGRESSKGEMEAQSNQHTTKLEKISCELSALEGEMESINMEKNRNESITKRILEEVERISSEENKKFEILKRSYPDTYEAVCWLQEHQNSFKAPISMPPLISIEVIGDENRKFLENTISKRDLLMFVCENKQDLERFMNVMKWEKKLCINVTMAPEENMDAFPSPTITGDMRNLGMQCFLKDLFNAPESVMRFLCKLNRIHRVPVCDNKAESNIEHILQYNSLFFTPTERITGTRSLYGNKNLSVKRDFIVDRKILPNIKDNSETLQDLEKRLKDIQNELNQLKSKFQKYSEKRAVLEKKQEQWRREKSELQCEINKVNEIKFLIQQLTDRYNKKKSEVIDEVQEKTVVTKKICDANNERKDILSKMHRLVKEFILLKKEKLKKTLVLKFFCEKISSLESEINTREKAQQDLERCLAKKTEESDEIKKQGFKLYYEIKAKDEKQLQFLIPSHPALIGEDIASTCGCQKRHLALDKLESARKEFDCMDMLTIKKLLASQVTSDKPRKRWAILYSNIEAVVKLDSRNIASLTHVQMNDEDQRTGWYYRRFAVGPSERAEFMVPEMNSLSLWVRQWFLRSDLMTNCV
ncbi:structural maintenance of chromosomes protein 5 [Nephila pilipes]|uniref:Structural maintenance of chromosomes protein 5 n=1 Tax=Nephila pilipes TaxID=299642 RepID=A0A8X6TGK4_NEPPI|nr:structural maintenance of chromosomes protein 5 [Nephila pilipes]